MTPLSLLDLWLPILAAWIVTHILSTLAWTVLPHHKPEWKHLPHERGMDTALGAAGATAGEQYLLSTGEAHDTDPSKCRGMVILWDHTPSMAKNIGMTLGYFLLVATTVGYLASIALPAEAAWLDVFRFTATAALLAHVFGGAPTVIWFRRKVLMDWIDGLAYSLATGAAFALLWPAA